MIQAFVVSVCLFFTFLHLVFLKIVLSLHAQYLKYI